MNYSLNVDGFKPITGVLEKISEPVPDPDPVSVLYVLRGDEELEAFDYKSRTAGLDYTWTPSVFRYDKKAVPPKSDYRVDVSPMLEAIRKLNNYNEKAINYLFSDKTAIYNGTGYPRQMYITMTGNKLEMITIEGSYLKFKTLTPSSNVSGMTVESHPQFVHTFDLVGYVKNDVTRKWETLHKPNTPQGVIRYFLVTNEGYAYLPLEKVKLNV